MPPRSILFVELLGGFGDLVIALPAIQALARSHPQARLDVATFRPGAELVAHDPLVHHVLAPRPKAHLQDWLGRVLREAHYDLVVSDTMYDGIPHVIEERVSLAVTDLWRGPGPEERVGERFVRILLQDGLIDSRTLPPPSLHLPGWSRRRAGRRLPRGRPLVVLFPEAGMKIKSWPLSRFVALGRRLEEGWAASILVAVGSDQALALRLAEQLSSSTRIWPRGSLILLAATLSHADLVVAADTGPAHLAAALGVPTVTLFGPSWAGRYGHGDGHADLQGFPDCPLRVPDDFTVQPCWYSGECPLDVWGSCTEGIAPEQVEASAGRLLARRAS
ncbi:MAG: glycosyltransferase family 9 protein [Actinomycetota bacterium]|nr:glycosyltransferase family 9 protein [Actinomycetota bacterium]